MAIKKQLGRLTPVPLREAWEHEAGDFTPWLAQEENLALLAETLGLDELALVATEHWIGDFKLDILCTDGEDQVIIENQLTETDHRHLGQLIAYAAGAGASKVIWIAESFRPEHLAALNFLNERSDESLAFFGVQIELWQIADSSLAPKFEVVARPDNWSRASRQQVRAAAEGSPTRQLQLQLWTALRKELGQQAPHLSRRAPRAQHWMSFSIGRSGFALNATANTRDNRLAVEIWITHPESKRQFARLTEDRETIESELRLPLAWQELPDSHACRIVTYLQDAPLEDQARWPEYLDWFVARLQAMERVFRPRIRALP
jgi:hypothetical protein